MRHSVSNRRRKASDPNDPVVRIKDEGMNQSQVMQTLSYTSFGAMKRIPIRHRPVTNYFSRRNPAESNR